MPTLQQTTVKDKDQDFPPPMTQLMLQRMAHQHCSKPWSRKKATTANHQ